MSKYFRLYEECYLQIEEKNCAVYNTFNGKVYIITFQEARLLAMLENNLPIGEIVEKYNVTENFIMNTLNKFIKEELGTYYNSPIYVAKLVSNYDFNEKLFFKTPPDLRKVVIKLSNACSKNCKICKRDKINMLQCISCNRCNDSKEVISKEVFWSIIDKLKKTDCRLLQIKIPDITYDFNYFYGLLLELQRYKFNVMLLLGTDEMDDPKRMKLEELGFYISIQKRVDSQDDIDEICNNLKKYKRLNNFSQILLLINASNKNELDLNGIVAYMDSINVMIDYVYDLERFEDQYQQVKNKYISEIPNIDIHTYGLKKFYNSCLYGQIYIDCFGRIYPCAGLCDYELGTIKDIHSLWTDELIFKFWKLRKSCVEKCKDCALNNACNDCRAITYQIKKDLLKSLDCKIC